MDLRNLINLISKHKNKIFNIAIIILALIIANNIYKSQVKNIKLLVQTKDTETKKNKLLENISQLEKRINSFKKVVNDKDISLIPNRLSGIAEKSLVKIISFKPQREKDYFMYVKYPFALVIVSPDYHRIGKFISKIENSPDIYRVEDINIRPISKQEKQDKGDKLTARLRLSTFLIKD